MILVIPDIHGRKFWKDVIDNIEKYEKVIFLGDYLDPYDFEGISVENAIDNFKEIIELKKNNMDKVILLLGNHDIYYYFELRGPSRWSFTFHNVIEDLFEQNKELFQIAYETNETLYTHSGFLVDWAKIILENWDYVISPTSDSLNSLLNDIDCSKTSNIPMNIYFLNMISHYRGGRFRTGSCIWADVDEHSWNNEYDGKFQVFGHSLQLDTREYYSTYDETKIKSGNPIITDKYAMLDCRSAFEYNEETKEFNRL